MLKMTKPLLKTDFSVVGYVVLFCKPQHAVIVLPMMKIKCASQHTGTSWSFLWTDWYCLKNNKTLKSFPQSSSFQHFFLSFLALCLVNVHLIVNVEGFILQEKLLLLTFNKTLLGARCAALPGVWTVFWQNETNLWSTSWCSATQELLRTARNACFHAVM